MERKHDEHHESGFECVLPDRAVLRKEQRDRPYRKNVDRAQRHGEDQIQKRALQEMTSAEELLADDRVRNGAAAGHQGKAEHSLAARDRQEPRAHH